MVQVAVNRDGSEVIGDDLFRAIEQSDMIQISDKINGEFWASTIPHPDWGLLNISLILPKGSIKKLIGKELTWNDEPVKLK